LQFACSNSEKIKLFNSNQDETSHDKSFEKQKNDYWQVPIGLKKNIK
jgi:hypothetical protein